MTHQRAVSPTAVAMRINRRLRPSGIRIRRARSETDRMTFGLHSLWAGPQPIALRVELAAVARTVGALAFDEVIK